MNNWILTGKPALVFAPMEGVTDAPMRALMTEDPGFTHCVTEFLRINRQELPPRCFVRHARELKANSRTEGGVPVIFQLLGGDPEILAKSAALAARLGALGIDLNFGCPAPTVNRHDGGATLLKYPDRIEAIVRAVRQAVPKEVPVSAKLRLGWDDPSAIHENAERAARGGASWITIHGRTKTQGYQPPAYWERIGTVRRALNIPVIANGDIWTREDFLRCREETQCEHFMIGRGALANPYLARQIAQELGLVSAASTEADFPEAHKWRQLLLRFLEISDPISQNPQYSVSRIKQWLSYVAKRRPFPAFHDLKRITDPTQFRARLLSLTWEEWGDGNHKV